MTDQFERLNALMQPLQLSANLYPPNSRYHGLPITVREGPDGEPVAYLRRRIVPQPERFSLLQWHTISEGDRLDNLAAHYLGDPEQFWRLCDANRAMRPDDLTATSGERLRITLPEGLQGLENG